MTTTQKKPAKITRSDYLSISVLVMLPLLVFRQYLSGQYSPSWDFLGDYLTNAISWWNLSTFFNPAIYIPYAFSGYPAYLSAQSSAWYFPYVILDQLNLISSYPLAVLQVFTIIFGLLGLYFFARSWNLSSSISLLLALGYLFSPGFFTSASHIDIVRAWAFMPWMFLALKPSENMNSRLRIFFITLLAFQYLVGVYPGAIIASVYIFLIYLFFIFIIFRPNIKNYLIFQIFPFIIGALLSLIKWLPFAFEERIFRGGNTVVVNQGIISTLLYPYETTILPNDITMRSLFIAPLILLSVLFIKRINTVIIMFFSILVISIFLGFDFNQIEPWQNSLPLLGESRFRTTDFKIFITIAVLILGGIGISQAMEKGVKPIRAGLILVLAFGYVTTLNFLAKNGGLQVDVLAPGNLIARVAGAVFFVILVLLIFKIHFNLLVINSLISLTMIIGTIFIGWFWALQSPSVWQTDRQAAERFYYGETSSEINKRVRNYEPTYREQRSGPAFPIPYPAELTFQTWNKAEIEKSFTLGGLVSLKGVVRFEDFIATAMQADAVNYYELLRLPLTGWIVDREKADLFTADCILKNDCTYSEVAIQITDWSPEKFKVILEDSKHGLLVVNEVPWRGWMAEVCDEATCTDFAVASDISDKLVSIEVSESTTSVTFYYKQPLRLESWISFWVGIGLLATLLLIARNRNLKSR